MVDIQSKEVIDKISEELKIQPATQIPRELAKQIQLTYNVGGIIEKNIISVVRKTNTTTSGIQGIFTSDPNKDTFLTSVSISYIKDSTCDDATGMVAGIEARPFGETPSRQLISHAGITLTASSGVNTINFNPPLKLSRGSTVSIIGGTFTVGVKVRTGEAIFFTTDPQ